MNRTMRVFVYEFVCAQTSGALGPESLHKEGAAMLAAVLDDFRRLGVETSTLENIASDEEEAAFRRLARDADYTLVIAPEFADILATRCRWVEEAGGRSLGSSLDAVRLTGDKLALGRHLRARGVPTPECIPIAPGVAPGIAFPAVWKPRDGTGSTATFLVRDLTEVELAPRRARQEGWDGEAILQPFVAGQPASVAVLIGPRHRVALLPAAQHLSSDGRFHYLGGEIPLPSRVAERAQTLALQAVAAVPGLQGYVGVDVVLGDRDWVIEINPRLTTSYIGLRRLAERNLMGVLLDLIEGKPVPPLAWRSGSVTFAP